MTTDRAGYGVLSDESFERSRQRIGIPLRISPAHITEVTADATRHFAYGYGDDNPLYCDPEYGKDTRWGGLIAPPNFTYCMGENAAPPPTPSQKELLKGDPFAGLGSYQAAMEFEYYRPLTAGDRCHVIRAQVGVADKPSRFGGRTAHVTHDFLFANGHGQIVTVQRGTWINAERHASKDRATEKAPLSFDPYTDEQLAEIDAAYDAETRRGPQPRYFEDVEVGEEIQPRVKGPLVVTDLIVWHLGWGMQLTPPGAFAIARKIRRKAPGLYPPNARNIPDTVQRLHWDSERAQELGIPMNYDYGGDARDLADARADRLDGRRRVAAAAALRAPQVQLPRRHHLGPRPGGGQGPGRRPQRGPPRGRLLEPAGRGDHPGHRRGAAADAGPRGRASRAPRRHPGRAARGRDRAPRVNEPEPLTMNHGAQVDFELTEEQAALREVSRGLLAVNCPPQLVRSLAAAGQDVDEKLWQRGAELGWTGLAVPEELDGAGQGVVELCLVAEELGRAAAPGPFLDSALTALALARAGRRAELVGSLAAGEVKASVAHHGAVTGSWDGDELVLSGRATAVQAAASADWLLVTVAVGDGVAAWCWCAGAGPRRAPADAG